MSIPKSKYQDISFSTDFNYLHVIKQGTFTSQYGTYTIPLPSGYDFAFFRVFHNDMNEPSFITTTGGYNVTSTEAHIEPGVGLVINHWGDGTTPILTFNYFIYGGDYSG